MNFRNSDCATVRVDYIRCSPHGDVDSAVCGKRAVSNFETVFGRIKSFNCRSTSTYVDKKVFARRFRIPEGSCFSIAARKNRPGSARLRGIQH